MFRMLDMPIEQIKLMLCETDELDNLLGKQEKVLEKNWQIQSVRLISVKI